MAKQIKIVALGGSLRPNSRTYHTLELAMDYLRARGCDVELIDLRIFHLPFCDGGNVYPDYPDVVRFQNAVKQSHALILATPEYHGAMSGVIKNALDLLDFEHMSGKLVALIGVLGGQHSTNALNSLRVVCRQLHAWVLPEQLIIADADNAFDQSQKLINPDYQKRLEKLMDSLLIAAHKLAGE